MMTIGRKIVKVFLSRIRGRVIYKQELLLRKALKEKGLCLKDLTIKCDHDLGLNYVNGIKMGIKYPDSFFDEAVSMNFRNKNTNIYFNGYINESGGRNHLLQPFRKLPHTVIISSEEGRVQEKKDVFNRSYFLQLADSKFGLCPHQLNWSGSREHLWTYRFIECCLVGATPILFNATPLGHNFINGYYYIWDNDFLANCTSAVNEYSYENAMANQALAKKQFFLSASEITMIRSTL